MLVRGQRSGSFCGRSHRSTMMSSWCGSRAGRGSARDAPGGDRHFAVIPLAGVRAVTLHCPGYPPLPLKLLSELTVLPFSRRNRPVTGSLRPMSGLPVVG